MSVQFSNTPSSLLFHRLTLQANSADNNTHSDKDDFGISCDSQTQTISKSLPPLPQQQQEIIPPMKLKSKKVYQSISASTSSSSINSRRILNGSPIIYSCSSSKSSTSTTSTSNSHTVNTSSTMTNKEDKWEGYSTVMSPNLYDNDSDENTLSPPRVGGNAIGSTEKNYDLSYYFHQEENYNNNYDSPNTSPLRTAAGNRREDNVPPKEDIYASSNTLYRARSLSIGSTISSHFISSLSTTATATTTTFSTFTDREYENESLHDKDKNNQDKTSVATPNCKVQQFFRKKTDKSNKKTYQHFSDQSKLEISVKEIKREGLKALLYSTVPLGYFLYHLLNEYSSENLFFYLAVENYQNYNFASDLERQQVAHKISKSYLTRNSELEVNLEDQISRKVKKALIEQQKRPSDSTGNEFDLAKRHVFSLLNVKYYQFRTSSVWNIMESKCSDLNSVNRERSQALVVNLLLSYIKRNNSLSLFKLVHSFCKIYLPIGYESRLSTSNAITKEKSCSKNNRNRSKSVGGSEKKSNSSFISNKIDTIFFKSNKINR